MFQKFNKYKPSANSSLLVFLAGMVWLCVGAMLVYTAYTWLSASADMNHYFPPVIGLLLALLIHHFGLLRIVDKNLLRILPVNEDRCIFSFIPLRGYLVIALMVLIGGVLRHSAIPKQYLAVFYIAMGMALILSSMRYIRVFLREIK